MTITDISPSSAAVNFLSSVKRPIHLLVAISGGSDSTGLLLALSRAIRLRGLTDVTLSAATIDHALRAASAGEAIEVAALCRRLAIPHTVRRWDDDKPTTGISAAAREARYRLLADIAETIGADAIVTAHTRDDQEETVVMRSARSEDQNALGLAGMAPATLYGGLIWILRPFLGCRRQDIRADLLSEGEAWIDDPSNLDARYERVQTRLALAASAAPMEPISDPGARRAQISAAAADLVARHASLHAGAVLHIDPNGLAAQSDVLRYALAGLLAVIGGVGHRPGRAIMDKVLAFATSAQGRMTASRCLLQRRRDGLYILREDRAILPLVVGPGQTGLWDGRLLVRNRTSDPVTVEVAGACGARIASTALPSVLLQHLNRVLPGSLPEDVDISPALPHFDRFLPDYDLAFANEVARLFGRRPYPPPPRASC